MTPEMASIFITGSADGLGSLAARLLIAQGHAVTLHGRSPARAQAALAAAPGAAGALTGDLASLAATRALVAEANAAGRFDAVIHNAAVGYREPRTLTDDGLEHIFQINVVAAYLLTAAMTPPRRLIYLSSGMHLGGDPDFDDLGWERRRWSGAQAYSDSKLMDTALAFALARRWPGVAANAVSPGWVATKMGGRGAPDDLELAPRTQVWLAAGEDDAAGVSGRNLFHGRDADTNPMARDPEFQERVLVACAEATGVPLPDASAESPTTMTKPPLS